ncbi:MAG: hypothetical protein JWN34_318 [Bryobacterales bacterium]|nr:hypothetical protein [Bryobacterales bacterium]
MTDNRLDDPDHIAISKSSGIKIDWKDGHKSSYDVVYLRDWCPCASCTGSHGTAPRPKTTEAPNPFQMFQPRIKMLNVEPVGNYAIRIEWSDGHKTGIYSWAHLRSICDCDQCRAAKG